MDIKKATIKALIKKSIAFDDDGLIGFCTKEGLEIYRDMGNGNCFRELKAGWSKLSLDNVLAIYHIRG